MRQLEIENQLREVVSRIVVQVELATAQGRTDINLALEDAFIPILKSIYNLPQLVNLNRKQKNYPGIDLGDDHDRVAFQITSTTTLDKVKGTIRQFMDRAYYNDFDELFILMLSRKQASYSQPSVNELLTDQFAFNCKKHIIDLSDLLGQVSGLRLAAQERVLAEFRHILGEIDAFISFSAEGIAAPVAITTNLQRIGLPDAAYVAELTIDDKAVISRAKRELNYKGYAKSRKAVVKMALLLNGVETDAWVCHDNKLFSFLDIEQCGLRSVVDEGLVERLAISDLADSPELDNVNILKQLLSAETQERLKKLHVRMHAKDRFFFFGPVEEGQTERKETWVGKRAATRRVYELKYQRKDPTKVAHHTHFSFELTFTKLDDDWYVQIVPSWYYSYNGYVRSNWHEDLLSTQKALEHNASVRNMVRFLAHFLSKMYDVQDDGVRFLSLLEFDVGEANEGDQAESDEGDDLAEGAVA
ncbi:SMEK domain-containing protein [Methylobacterium mesophilicum SR1.6/6]|uniref:SMEK domain-containing protein n=1 Tax=Methylobacterium mesophilicum SR1.6/6 TaxID=908290 RepID=A0A6B9FIL0_9HYPH|nr:SMEK domain-containing protein [Methylobacterium mesophilicum]QGY01606.1 SMEK domain-containing protein [Methylobacterium mesophilicum SR1.6/6]